MNYVKVQIPASSFREAEQMADGRWLIHFAKKDEGNGVVSCAETLSNEQPTPEMIAQMEEEYNAKECEYEAIQEGFRVKAEVAELKLKLNETDYMAIKYAEGWISADDYAEVKAQRQAWRDRINEIENA